MTGNSCHDIFLPQSFPHNELGKGKIPEYPQLSPSHTGRGRFEGEVDLIGSLCIFLQF